MGETESQNGPGFSPENVAMLCQGDEVYGVGTVLQRYAETMPDASFVALGKGPMVDWLRERRHRVDVVEGLCRYGDGGNSLAVLMRTPRALRQAKRDAAAIDELLRPRNVQIIHAHWRPQQYIAGYMRDLGYRSVWHIHNNMNRRRLMGLGRKLNHRAARWGADLLIPVSAFIGQNWDGCGVPMKVIYNSAPAIFSAPNELPDSRIRCVVGARLDAEKGHHLAIAAVIGARQAGLDVRLDVFGGPLDSPYALGLQRQVSEADCRDVVRFMGFQTDLRSRHQEYHLGLQCRITPEPCSVWVCETHVDGLPLLASASGGTPELVEDGITGVLFRPGDFAHMTRKLIELASDPGRLQGMRTAAFKRGRQMFTVERFHQETLSAYASLVVGKGERSATSKRILASDLSHDARDL